MDNNKKTSEGVEKAALVQVVLPCPMKLDAGQYINLWMPTAQNGLSATLFDCARAASGGSVSFSAFVTGPHGISEPIAQYESVLLIADGAGIAAMIPYLKKLIYGYNTLTCRTRRVHLVWQLRTLDMAIVVESSVNSLLKDDTVANGYILTISIYVEFGGIVKLGNHERAFVYKGLADYRNIIQTEVSGNGEDDRGELLVMVSASDKTRDQLRSIVRDFLHDKVTMTELEFQPH
ncbi:ferric-chelate reductase [Histoplasma capsulatum H143]|uniref:Ferric-chelate reductase n=1 Tax=Ajellomyces capsulatus (strain H143) TaxID=544712 RepID=C6HA62_AJECH|nr:ferric-chelate reductase [Histoplasma capsulatum H143]